MGRIKDIFLYFPGSFPGVLLPFWSWKVEDELCLLSPGNIRALILHVFLIPTQIGFLSSVFGVLLFPVTAGVYLVGIIIALWLNASFCKLLNGDGSSFVSTTDQSAFPPHDDECWIFINGVSAGRHWFQTNLNVLSLIFGRKFIGIHNPTYGIVFDLLECIIQRDFNFVTDDIRRGYAQVKDHLLDGRKRKIVLIVHSQGGIEASAILDWLLDDLPSDVIGKLEIYTFGSAANHFNNPRRSASSVASASSGSAGVQRTSNRGQGVVNHIEHYTNSGDFVSRFGILGFIRLPPNSSVEDGKERNHDDGSTTAVAHRIFRSAADKMSSKLRHNRFNGVLFNHNATGHMLNQHYLATMFRREPYTLADGTVGQRVADNNEFMDSEISAWDGKKEGQCWGWPWQSNDFSPAAWSTMVLENGVDLCCGRRGTAKIVRPRELSRLWLYRNSMSPPNDDNDNDNDDYYYEQNNGNEDHVIAARDQNCKDGAQPQISIGNSHLPSRDG